MSNESQNAIQSELVRGMQRARAYDWVGAIGRFRHAVALDPNSLEARFRLGWALWMQADEDKPSFTDMAMAMGAHALGFDQPAQSSKRKFQSYRQRLNEALHYLDSVLERDDNHSRAHHYRARVLQALDRKAEAEEAAHRASLLAPDNANYKNFALQFSPTTYKPDNKESNPSSPATWEDLVLNPKTKRELYQMQLVLERPDMASELGVQPPTGILLKGPPGTGKTTIARVLAHQAKCAFFSITPADINQMYVGESEKRVKELFARARTSAPAIVFIDEIDALLPIRQGGIAIHYDKVVNQFLQEMDGITANHRVFIVGATNRPDMLDPAVRRGGRLSREIEIPLPDNSARIELLKLCTRRTSLESDVDLNELARLTDGYSGADIKALVNEAGLQALIRIADSNTPLPRTLTMLDFKLALENLG